MARIEQEKLKIVQNKQETQINIRVPSNEPDSPASKRRNKFRNLLQKYSAAPLNFDGNKNSFKSADIKGYKSSTYVKPRELDKMNQRTDDELLEEQNIINNILRQKLKVVSEHLSKVVDKQIKSNLSNLSY